MLAGRNTDFKAKFPARATVAASFSLRRLAAACGGYHPAMTPQPEGCGYNPSLK